jgi:hypothetical protein
MLKVDDTGRGVLQFESTGVVRRIPLERRGHTKGGKFYCRHDMLNINEKLNDL